MRNYHQYIKSEDLDWYWSQDQKTKTHRLTLKHIPSGKTVSGTFVEFGGRGGLMIKKRQLQEDLTEKLEALVFDK